MKSIVDQIYDEILKEKRSFSNQEIIKRFFKIVSIDDETAEKIIKPILKDDKRFKALDNNNWNAVKITDIDEMPIADTSFILFYIEDIAKDKNYQRVFEFSKKELFEIVKNYSSFILYKGGITIENLDIKDILKYLNRYIFIPYDLKSLNNLKKLYRTVSPLSLDIKTLSIKNLISILFPDKRLKSWDDIVKEFSLMNLYSENPSSRVKTLMHIFEHILSAVHERNILTTGHLKDLLTQNKKMIDFTNFGFNKDFLKNIPEMPGVYMFLNKNNNVIYVGKTVNLRQRINSYFWNTGESIEKIKGIINNLFIIKYKMLGSDFEALLNEYRLIDNYKPAFNQKINISERAIEIADKIIILPSLMEGMLKLYFLSNRIPLIEVNFDCKNSLEIITKILKKIRSSKDFVFDPLKVIAISYIKRYEDHINSIDIDKYGTDEDILEAIKHHCKNPDKIQQEKTMYI